VSDDPCWLGVADLAGAFRSGARSPADHLELLLARIDALDPQLHSFLHLDRDGARAAVQDSPTGPLAGVPIAIKDVIDVAGMPTTCHSRVTSSAPATTDAAVVTRLRDAGAIILGKLATHEFAIGGPAFDLPWPPARNPWNSGHHPGGSSSGAGTAVAAGLVPAAIGTDTAGSVRHPASACGIVGLKPTIDAVPCTGVFPLAWSLDHVGPLTRDVADCALLFDVLAARTSAPPKPVHGVRIGVVRHWHERDMIADREVAAALDRVVAALERAGARVADVTLPPLELLLTVNRVILQSEGFALHATNLRERPDQYGKLTRAALLPGAFTTAEDYLTVQRRRTELTAAMERVFETVDVLLCASSMEPPCRIDDEAAIAHTYLRSARQPFNLTGHPALAMMSGLSSDGLPLSVQFAGRRNDEAAVFGVAAAWEAAMGGPRRPPL
jgi:aspartyl-tRNA(Asn)/glutamyl-tRNA(Gln) amidotransferase subunit A